MDYENAELISLMLCLIRLDLITSTHAANLMSSILLSEHKKQRKYCGK